PVSVCQHPQARQSTMLHWYLVHTKPAGEALAKTNLERQAYQVYLPWALQTIRRCGKWRERVVPLFPRYLFLRLDQGRQPLGPVQSTLGVSSVVRFGLQFTLVPDRVIGDLQSRADPVTGLHRLSCAPALTPGSSVRISMGPFEGLEGIFERQAGSERVVVLLRVLGQNASVCVDL